jgi:Xaa-Pro aminopeptidase
VTVARKPGAAQARARAALAAALAVARGGGHLPEDVAANAIGLSLEEGPALEEGPGSPLEAGAVYAVTGSATEGAETAYASAVVAVTENGCETLWQGAPT